MSRRRRAVVVLVVLGALLVVSLLGTALDPEALLARWFSDDAMKKPLEFYPVDEQLNIFEDDEYASLDSRVFYTDPATGETYSIEPEELALCEEAVKLFYDYFETVIRGDAFGYYRFFTDSYLMSDKAQLPGNFTMQMIYDIRIEPRPEYDEDGESAYLVEYKIHKNNGTFRDDVESDAAKAQLIYLCEEQGQLLISRIVTYMSYR